MGRVKHKITSAVEAQINELAKSLPVAAKLDIHGQPVYKPGAVDGSMIEKDKHGKKGVPGVLYTANVLQYMNHRQELFAAYQADGDVGLNHYVEHIQIAHARRQEFVKENRPGLWSRIKSFFVR